MSTSIDLVQVDFDDGDYEWLTGNKKTLTRAREGLTKAKVANL